MPNRNGSSTCNSRRDQVAAHYIDQVFNKEKQQEVDFLFMLVDYPTNKVFAWLANLIKSNFSMLL